MTKTTPSTYRILSETAAASRRDGQDPLNRWIPIEAIAPFGGGRVAGQRLKTGVAALVRLGLIMKRKRLHPGEDGRKRASVFVAITSLGVRELEEAGHARL